MTVAFVIWLTGAVVLVGFLLLLALSLCTVAARFEDERPLDCEFRAHAREREKATR